MANAGATLNEIHHEDRSVVEYLILALAGAGGVILILTAASQKSQYLKEVLLGLGHAFVIAALVGIFVEIRLIRDAVKRMEAVHTRTIDEVRKIIVRDLRKYLPGPLVDALENQVLNPIFLREEFTIAISLNTEGEGGEKYVKGSIAMSYFVKNISTKDQDHVIRCNLDEVLGEGSACLESVTLDNQPLNLSKLPIGTKVHRDSNVLKFEHPIRIRQGSGVRVQIVGYQRMAQADLWPWHMLTPSDSMTVTVNNSTDLEVLLTLLHPAADEADNQVSHSLWNAQVTINNIVLPYQGFEVRWWPRPPVTAKALAQNASPSRPVENKLKEGGSLAGVEKPATPANSETAPPGRVD